MFTKDRWNFLNIYSGTRGLREVQHIVTRARQSLSTYDQFFSVIKPIIISVSQLPV